MVRLSRTLHSVPQWQYFTATNSFQGPEHEFLRRLAQKHKIPYFVGRSQEF